MTAVPVSQTARPLTRLSRSGAAFETVLLVENIHCPSCVSYVQDVLRPIPGIINVDVSILTHQVRVQHTSPSHREIYDAVTAAAFDVHHVSSRSSDGTLLEEFVPRRGMMYSHRLSSTWSILLSNAQKQHIKNCDACQAESSKTSQKRTTSTSALAWQVRHGSGRRPKARRTASVDGIGGQQNAGSRSSTALNPEGDLDAPTQTEPHVEHYEAQLSIEGMTCASCSGKITEELESLDFVQSVAIRLISNIGTVRYYGSADDAQKLVEAIEEIGYGASIDAVNVLSPPANTSVPGIASRFTVSLSIEGMTCGSCVGTITRGLDELPFVHSVSIDLVGHSGKVEFEGEINAERILETIDDLGYDATILSKVLAQSTRGNISTERTVTLRVDGLYCRHCPSYIEEALRCSIGDGEILRHPTLSEPLVTIKYTPVSPTYTMRSFITAIEQANDSFRVSVYRPPSPEERSRSLQKREQWRILARLIFTFVMALPTFVIGIVYMSLVPKSDSTRMWLMDPVWVGSVSRTEWSLFFMTTPVMFFGADYFHTRAIKEIRALWRPGSKTPILRRFYRFGSMNLLISAGTSVAYFSSLAVLVMDATAKRQEGMLNSTTYFDSVTFLTFFILIGKFLEAYSKAKTGDAVSMLSKLRPREAQLIESTKDRQKTVRTISVDMLEVGDVVSVPHGTSPPSDGIVVNEGTFLFDESSLTGESRPVRKTSGDKVFTGSVNTGPPVRINVTEVGGDSMLDQIVTVVREGQTKRAPIERVADFITGYFVPVITLLAIITFVIWVSLGESGVLPKRYLDGSRGGWPFWSLEFAIAVFVVACPCGIGLAAPTALFVGGGMAAKKGILVQGGGEAFQEASRIDTMVFDKTGTLTEGGSLKVIEHEIIGNEEHSEEIQIALRMAQVMEESSNHPIAKAIVDFCRVNSVGDAKVTASDIEELGGQGMRATFSVTTTSKEQHTYEAAIGNQRLLSSLPSFDSSGNHYLDPILTRYQSLGHSTAILAIRKTSTHPLRRMSETSEQTLIVPSTTPSPLSSRYPSTSPSTSPSTATFKPILVFAISDPIRPSALAVLDELRESRKIDVHMCTGDNATTAHAVAARLGIPAENVRAGCLPGDKAAYIRALQGLDISDLDDEEKGKKTKQKLTRRTGTGGNKNRKIVAFVGDGTNDTPALTAADVSIALASGSDVALTSASFILLSRTLSLTTTNSPSPSPSQDTNTNINPTAAAAATAPRSSFLSPKNSSPDAVATDLDLSQIVTLLHLSRRVFRRVKLNFIWAAVYNVLLIPVAAGVFFSLGTGGGTDSTHGGEVQEGGTGFRLSPVWAAVAMALSSVSVVLGSLGLKWGI